MIAHMQGFAPLGQGLGLRPPFYEAAAGGHAPIEWWEVITENFMVAGGNPRATGGAGATGARASVRAASATVP